MIVLREAMKIMVIMSEVCVWRSYPRDIENAVAPEDFSTLWRVEQDWQRCELRVSSTLVAGWPSLLFVP
jgi:hypothetical protein